MIVSSINHWFSNKNETEEKFSGRSIEASERKFPLRLLMELRYSGAAGITADRVADKSFNNAKIRRAWMYNCGIFVDEPISLSLSLPLLSPFLWFGRRVTRNSCGQPNGGRIGEETLPVEWTLYREIEIWILNVKRVKETVHFARIDRVPLIWSRRGHFPISFRDIRKWMKHHVKGADGSGKNFRSR